MSIFSAYIPKHHNACIISNRVKLPENSLARLVFILCIVVKRGRNCGQIVSPRAGSVSLKMKKSLKTLRFQGLTMVEISGIEPLTS